MLSYLIMVRECRLLTKIWDGWRFFAGWSAVRALGSLGLLLIMAGVVLFLSNLVFLDGRGRCKCHSLPWMILFCGLLGCWRATKKGGNNPALFHAVCDESASILPGVVGESSNAFSGRF